MCPNKVCLPKSAVCDGVVDCKDRSDELNCTRACEFQPLHLLLFLFPFIYAIDYRLIRLLLFLWGKKQQLLLIQSSRQAGKNLANIDD